MKAPLSSVPGPELRSPLTRRLLRLPSFRKEIWLRVKDALTDTFSNCPPGTEASRRLLRGHLTRWEHSVQKQGVRGVAEGLGELAAGRGSNPLPSPCGGGVWEPLRQQRGLVMPKLHVSGHGGGGTAGGLSRLQTNSELVLS